MSDASRDDDRRAIVPLVLAAGASSRMGAPKAGLVLGGRTALRWVLDACAREKLGDPVVVTGAHPDAVRAAAEGVSLAPLLVANPEWARGRTTSIRVGLSALRPGASAFLLWPVDVPLAGEGGTLALLLAARARGEGRARAWVPSHDGHRGHPILLERSVEGELAALGDDVPAREVVRALASRGELAHVLAPDPAVLWDMDTPEDLERLERELARRARGLG